MAVTRNSQKQSQGDQLMWLVEAEECRRSLKTFLMSVWGIFEPREFVGGWVVDCLVDHLESVTRGDIRHLLINIPPRHSKPVYDESLVLMHDGSRKPISEIRIGEQVITHTGQARKVTDKVQQGWLPCVEITTDLGRSVVAALDHPFLTPDGWMDAGDLQVGMSLANVASPKTQPCQEHRPLEEFRLAGYFIGDGSVGPNGKDKGFAASMTSADPDIIADLFHCAEVLGFAASDKGPNTKSGVPVKAHRITFSKGVRPWLEKVGLARKNSYTKRVPEFVFQGTNEQIAHFIAAYFMCDGTLGKKGNVRTDLAIEVSSVAHALLLDLQHLYLRLGIQSRVVKHFHKVGEPGVGLKLKQPHNDRYISYRLTLNSQDELAKFKALIPIYSYKRDRIKDWPVYRRRFDAPLITDPIKTIEDVGLQPCSCITVDEDHTYTVEDIVCHNSSIVSVVWPLWGWLLNPSEQYLCSSFNLNLAIRDNTRKRRIIEDTWFNQRFGKDIVLSEEQNLKQYFTNTKNGHQQITSVGGSTTGLGGSVLICLDEDTAIITDQGEFSIGTIVENRFPCRVLSYNHALKAVEYRSIEEYERNPAPDEPFYRITFSFGSSIECTGNHPFYVVGKDDYVRADQLQEGDSVLTCPRPEKGTLYPTAIRTIRNFPAPRFVYNIRVEGNHNYFAGHVNHVLVHNCDDPHNVDEAYSDAERQSAVIWFRESWTNRMNNAAKDKMVVVGQRIHEDDVSGYILKERPDWDTLILPAFYEPARKCFTSIGWEDPRKEEGELLWPERFSQASLEGLRRDLGSTGFSSQYQQSPVPAGGGQFKEKWMRYFTIENDFYVLHNPDGNRHIPIKDCWKFMVVDLAISTKTDADYTVIQCWAVTKERDILLVDQFRDRLDNPAQQQAIKSMYYQHKPNFVQIENVAYQLAIIQQLLREAIPCREYKPVRDKISRASTAAVIMEQGKMYFRAMAPWLDVLKSELLHFPKASHDDCVDTCSMAADVISSYDDPHFHIAAMQARAALVRNRPIVPKEGLKNLPNGAIAS